MTTVTIANCVPSLVAYRQLAATLRFLPVALLGRRSRSATIQCLSHIESGGRIS